MSSAPKPPQFETLQPDLCVLRVPTPFPVGRASCTLIRRDPLTLVDTGPNSERTFEALVQGLALAKVAPADLRRIVITHLHLDHFGLARRLVELSGAQVFCHPALVQRLARFMEHWKLDDEHYSRIYTALDVPPEYGEMMRRITGPMLALGCELDNAQPLEHGVALEFDAAQWRVLHTPGHTPYCLSLLHERSSTLISGDFLLPHITPNPLLYRPDAPWGLGLDALINMLASLERAAELELELVVPGHGPTFGAVQGVIRSHLNQREQRHRNLLAALEAGPLSAYQLVGELFPTIHPAETFMGVSEVLGHLGLGFQRNQVRQQLENGCLRFSLIA